jgi:hypothetical protein
VLILALLAGCATAPEVRIEKPPVPPVIEVPEKPIFPKDAPVDAKLRSLVDYILVLRARLDDAVRALDVYR